MPRARYFALLLVCPALACAQVYAHLYGRVLDTSEAGIGQAAVTVVNEETGFRRLTQSDPSGGYVVSSLAPGLYKITVRKEGFRTAVRFGLKLAPSHSTRADFMLPVGSIEESITVTGTAPLVAQEDASTGAGSDAQDIERIPLNGRGILSLLEFAPGTNVTPATRGEPGQFSATGQRPNTNYFTVDGVSANTGVSAGGLPAQSTGGALPALSAFGSMDAIISLEAVQEFRVTTSSSVAEFGRLPGARVSLNSRSGSNEFHGSVLYRIRNEALNANDWFSNRAGYGPLPSRLHNVAPAFGGPLKRNRTFFFVSYERMALRQPLVWRQAVPGLEIRATAADWAQPLLNLFPSPGGAKLAARTGEWTGSTVRPASLDTGGARVDHALTSGISVFARYNDSPSVNEFGTLVVNRLDLRSQSLTAGLNARLRGSSSFDLRVNESQAQAGSQWREAHGCTLAPLIASFVTSANACDYLVRFSLGGIGQLVSGREGERRQRQFQLVPTVSVHPRGHTLGFGADYRRIRAVRRDPTGSLGLIADSIDALTDKRNLWIASAAAQNGDLALHEFSLWVQDTWQVLDGLTINAGLRWEYSPAPLPAGTASFLDPVEAVLVQERRILWPRHFRNFAPRLGIGWRIDRSGRTVIRAGGGLYYDSSMSIATDMLNGGPLGISSYSSGIFAPFSSQLTFGFMPELKIPVTGQWNMAVEHAFGARDAVWLGYVGAAGRRLVRRELGGAASSETFLAALTTNHGRSDYHSLQLHYRRRVTQGLHALAAYTWSHSLDNHSSDAFLAWVGKGSLDHASSDFDLRHTFNASLSYEPVRLHGWAADAVLHARTSFPITVLQAEQYQGITLANAFRPDLVYGAPLWIDDPASPGGRRLNPAAFHGTARVQQGTLGRNAIGGFGMSQIDLAIRKEFRWTDRRRMQLRLEAYNLLNQASFADPVRFLNSPIFGQSPSMLNVMLGTGSPGSGLSPLLQTGGARSLQGSVRFQF